MLFENFICWDPIHARGFYRDADDAMRFEPVCKGDQIVHKRSKRAYSGRLSYQGSSPPHTFLIRHQPPLRSNWRSPSSVLSEYCVSLWRGRSSSSLCIPWPNKIHAVANYERSIKSASSASYFQPIIGCQAKSLRLDWDAPMAHISICLNITQLRVDFRNRFVQGVLIKFPCVLVNYWAESRHHPAVA